MRLGVTLLGGFAVSVDEREVPGSAWATKRAVQLVVLLAMAPGQRLATEQVLDALWPQLAPEAARANLHKAATHARQALGGRNAVVLRGGVVALWPEAEREVDVAVFERTAAAALADGDADACARAADRFTGELLPEHPYEAWVAEPRERLRLVHLALLRGAGRWAEVVAADPTDEPAHLALMAEHQRAGRLHAAVRQFHDLRAALARELGVRPSAEAAARYRALLGAAEPAATVALVGREVELVRARAVWRRAADGRPAALLITGVPGVGKSTLLAELLDEAAAAGWRVLHGRTRGGAGVQPYGPVAEAVEGLLAREPALTGGLEASDRAVLDQLLLGEPRPDSVSVTRQDVLGLLGRVATAPSPAGAPAGAVLAVDDLHAADAATLDLVTHLGAAPSPRGMAVVAAVRPRDWPDLLAAAVNALRPIELELGPLTRREAEAAAAQAAGDALNPEECELLWQLAAGHPLLTVELALAVTRDREGDRPTGLQEAVHARLADVPRPEREALRRLAATGEPLTADEAALVMDIDPESAPAVLQHGAAAGLLLDEGATFAFRHALIRDALAHGQPEREAAAARLRLAQGLEAAGAPATRVATAFLAAGAQQLALPALRRAGSDLVRLGAHRDALALVERGLEVAPRDATLLELRADALHGLGDPRALTAFAVAQSALDGPARERVRIRRARAQVAAGDPVGALDVLDGAEAPDDAARVRLLVNRGLASVFVGDLDGAEADARDARRLAQVAADLDGFVDVTMLLGMVAHERGRWPQQLELDLFDRELLPEVAAVVMDGHVCAAESYLYGSVPYPEIVEFTAGLRARAGASGNTRAEAFAWTLEGEALLLAGDRETAVPALRAAVDLHRGSGMRCGEALSLQRLAEAALLHGSPAECERLLGAALQAARASEYSTRHLLDRIHGTAIRASQPGAQALAAVDEAVSGARGPMESCPPCSVTLSVPAAIACATAGEAERARAWLQSAETIVDIFWREASWTAALDEARGHVAAAEGDVDAANTAWGCAASAFAAWGQPLDAERCAHLGKVSGRARP